MTIAMPVSEEAPKQNEAESDTDSGGGTATAPARAHPKSSAKRASKPKPTPVDTLPLWSVLLHNDDHNDMGFVVDTICMVTPLNAERAVKVMLEAHSTDVALVCQTHKEVAELYRERFQSRGLVCTIEPAA